MRHWRDFSLVSDYLHYFVVTFELIVYHDVQDYIDLFLIHDPMSGSERRIATYKALLKAKDDGKIRSVGVSN
jgi:predicted oxidoreductase